MGYHRLWVTRGALREKGESVDPNFYGLWGIMGCYGYRLRQVGLYIVLYSRGHFPDVHAALTRYFYIALSLLLQCTRGIAPMTDLDPHADRCVL